MRTARGQLIALFELFSILIVLSSAAQTLAAPADRHKQTIAKGLYLPPEAGWDGWQLVREQRAERAVVKVFIPRGQAAATAKVRVVVTRMSKPSFDSPQGILDAILETAKHQCQRVAATTVRKSAQEIIFELRGFGCAGQSGERFLLQRIAFVNQSELQVTYAPMTPTDDLPPAEKRRALKLLSSARIAADSESSSPAAASGWFLITPPRKPDGHYDSTAPVSRWKIQEGAGSREKCERLLITLTSVVKRQGQPSDAEEVKHARCVSMDDPGLDNE
jgi:hypothetical protein